MDNTGVLANFRSKKITTLPFPIQKFKFHPKYPTWSCFLTNNGSIFYTDNFGDEWKFINFLVEILDIDWFLLYNSIHGIQKNNYYFAFTFGKEILDVYLPVYCKQFFTIHETKSAYVEMDDSKLVVVKYDDDTNVFYVKNVTFYSSHGNSFIQMLEYADYSVFITTREYEESFKTIYYSDSTGTRFYPISNEIYEFYNIKTLEGAFISHCNLSMDKICKTLITFDRGITWSPISISEQVLQLYNYPQIKDSPIGILIATGSHSSDMINTYLSRDGGVTWNEIAKGIHYYEIMEHGAILVRNMY